MSCRIVFVGLLAVSSAQAGVVIHVDAGNCPGPGSGTEGDPYCSIQTAIDNAVNTDEVIVADGIYTGPGNRDIDFGGRLITLRSANGPDNCIIDCQAKAIDPHRGFWFHGGETSDAVLDGFTIRNGFVMDPEPGGGGILCENSSPTIVNCMILDNRAGGSFEDLYGGGIYSAGGSPMITNCVIAGNVAIAHCGGAGGGLYLILGSPMVINCTISDNRVLVADGVCGKTAGGIYVRDANLIIAGCTISGNEASGFYTSGGGLTISRGVIATVIGCTFSENVSDFGGGMSIGGDSGVTVIDCAFTGNLGGGMSNAGDGGVTAINSTFTGNLGWGMLNSNGKIATVVNCTFTGNQDGGIRNHVSTLRVINCILWDNGPDEVRDLGATTVSFSDVQGGFTGTGNVDVDPLFVDADGPDDIPGTDDDDLRLQLASPCIDAGNNWGTAVDVADLDADGDTAELTPLDIDGNPRFADVGTIAGVGCSVPATVDMGAYEFQGQPATDPMYFGDLDGDGVVGIADLMFLNGCLGSIAGDCCIADLNFDGEVGMSDRSLLLAELIETVGGLGVAPSPHLRICEVAHVSASDEAFYFGDSVALDGDTSLIGARRSLGNTGSAFVFKFDGTGWGETQKLLASDGGPDEDFGTAVAVDGGTLMVAARTHLHGSSYGAVYVFDYDGSKWVETQQLTASEGSLVPVALSLDGDVAVIGNTFDGGYTGAAYIFRFHPISVIPWLQEQKLLVSDGAAGDRFGTSVVVSSDVVVIGAPGDDDNGSTSGAVYVYRFDGTNWVQEQKLLGQAPFWQFGTSLAMSGDVILVGTSVRAAQVFRFDPLGAPGSKWVAEQILFASDVLSQGNFGESVALDGDIALIGAFGSGYSPGATYVFRRHEDGGWREWQVLFPDSAPSGAAPGFGRSVALDGDNALIGARRERPSGAYMYTGLSGTNCNANGRSDACDILDGTSDDANGNGIPDECECVWDLDGDTNVGVTDLLDLLSRRATDPGGPPHIDRNATVDVADLSALLANWGPCP